MTRTELIAKIAEEMGIPKKQAAVFLTTFENVVLEGLKKNGRVRTNIGTFKVSKRQAREGVNPQNPKERIKIPAVNVVTFKAGKLAKEAVN